MGNERHGQRSAFVGRHQRLEFYEIEAIILTLKLKFHGRTVDHRPQGK